MADWWSENVSWGNKPRYESAPPRVKVCACGKAITLRAKRCTRCRCRRAQARYARTVKGRATIAKYEGTAKGRAKQLRSNAKRVYVGADYHGRVATIDTATRINAHIKERRLEFIARFATRTKAEGDSVGAVPPPSAP